MQLAGEPLPLRLLRLHGAAERVALHAACVLDRHGRLRREQRDDLLVLVGEASRRAASRRGRGSRTRRRASSPARRGSCASAGGSAGTRPQRGSRMRSSRRSGRASSIRTPRMPRPRGRSPIAARSASSDPEGDEPLELVAAAVDHAERRVARAGELGGDPDQRLQDGVERQLRGDRDSGLDEAPAPLSSTSTPLFNLVRRAAVPRLQADFTAMPPVPKPPTAKSGRNRNLIIALAVAAVVAAALIAGSLAALGRRRRRQRGNDRGDHRDHGDDRHDREPAPSARGHARGRDPPERNRAREARHDGADAAVRGSPVPDLQAATPTMRSPRSSTSTSARAGSRSTSAGSRSSAPTR